MKSTKVLVEVAIMVALAFVFEVIFTAFPGMPFGGRISLSMLPIIVISWRRGIVPGIITGILFSILNMVLDGFSPAAWGLTYQVFIAAMFLDYFIAFGIVGIAGLARKFFGESILGFGMAILIAGIARFICHLISGMVLWGVFAEEGQSVFMYSLTYNSTYMVPTIIFLLLVGIAIYFPLKPILEVKEI